MENSLVKTRHKYQIKKSQTIINQHIKTYFMKSFFTLGKVFSSDMIRDTNNIP